jgi:hypothetical protein
MSEKEKLSTGSPVRRIRAFELGATVPPTGTYLGMHIEQRDDGLRSTPTPVFYYEVTEKP